MGFCVEFWGDYACFTRPEFGAERVSYDVITPSAAKGLFRAIYWHPGIDWVIDEIRVCNPIKFTQLRRSELSSKVSARSVRAFMNTGVGDIRIDASKDRTQRASLLLKDVRYVIKAHFESKSSELSESKIAAIVGQRLDKGACFHEPYFGCREFHAYFKRCSSMPDCCDDLKRSIDLGYMLYDLDYRDLDNIQPMFYRPVMVNGVIEVPDRNSFSVIRARL